MKRTACALAMLLWVGASTTAAGNLEAGAKLFAAGKYAEALDTLKKAVDDDPGNPQVYLFMASSCEKLKKWDEAATNWEAFIKFAKTQAERDYALTRLKDCRTHAAGGGIIETTDDTKKTDTYRYSDYERHEGPFQSIRSDHFLVLCKNPALGRLASKEAERHLKRITSTFIEGREWPHVITIRIHRNHTEYVKEAGTPQWSGGGYMYRNFGPGNTIRRIELFALDDKGKYIEDLLTKTLPHELTHLVIHEYFGERTFSGLPLALNEGLAMYVEEGTAVIYEKQLCAVVKKGTYYKLGDLYKMRAYPEHVGLFYAEAASGTRFLIEHLSADQFKRFLGAIRKGSDVNSALQTATGRTGNLLEAMNANWVEMIKKKAVEYEKEDRTPDIEVHDTPPKTTETSKEEEVETDDDGGDVVIEVK